jgi:ATP-dependent Clp protease ATP-binding subunit ClpC
LLAKKGYDPVLGARPLRRTIQREIEDVLSEKILFGELKSGHIVVVDAEGLDTPQAAFTFRGEAKPALPALVPDVAPLAVEEAGPAAGSVEEDCSFVEGPVPARVPALRLTAASVTWGW